MPTFSELRADFDRIYIGEVETAGAHDATAGSGDRIDFLYAASTEMGVRLGIPRARYSFAHTASSAVEIILNGSPSIVKVVGSIYVNGEDIMPVKSYNELLKKRRESSRLKHFLHDRAYNTQILSLDYAVTNPSIAFEYTELIDPLALTTIDEPWTGAYPEYHHLVPLRAACKLWISSELYGSARFFMDYYNQEVAKFALEVGTPDAIAELQFRVQPQGQE